MFKYFFLFACIIGCLSGMEKPNNTYASAPKEDAPLVYDLVMTPFWKQLKESATQTEKDNELESVLQADELAWFTQRYYIAAALFGGACLNARPSNGFHALTKACYYNDLPLIQFLFTHNADLKLSEKLHRHHSFNGLLFFINKVDSAEYLIKKGAILHGKDTMGRSLLHTAMYGHKSKKLIPLYLEKNVAWDCHTYCDENVLHFLARCAHTYNSKPKLLKKFNTLVQCITLEQLYTLLSERDDSEKLPEEHMTEHSEPSMMLSGIMRQRRELLKARLEKEHAFN